MLPGDRRFIQSVNNASAMTDFYALGEPNTKGSDAFEKVLSTLEAAAAPVVRKVLDGTWPLVEKDRTVLAEFVTVQYLRGPDRRNHMQNMAAQFARMDISLNGKEWMAERFAEYAGRELDGEQVDRLWEQATRTEGPPLTVSPAEHIEQIVDLLRRSTGTSRPGHGRSFGLADSVFSPVILRCCLFLTQIIPSGAASVCLRRGLWRFRCLWIQHS